MRRKIKILFIGTSFTLLIVVALMVRRELGETIYASGYSEKKWDRVEIGMTKDKVLQLLGAPLDYKIEWGCVAGEEHWERFLWSRPKEGKGWFACIWFDVDRVARKQIWFDD